MAERVRGIIVTNDSDPTEPSLKIEKVMRHPKYGTVYRVVSFRPGQVTMRDEFEFRVTPTGLLRVKDE